MRSFTLPSYVKSPIRVGLGQSFAGGWMGLLHKILRKQYYFEQWVGDQVHSYNPSVWAYWKLMRHCACMITHIYMQLFIVGNGIAPIHTRALFICLFVFVLSFFFFQIPMFLLFCFLQSLALSPEDPHFFKDSVTKKLLKRISSENLFSQNFKQIFIQPAQRPHILKNFDIFLNTPCALCSSHCLISYLNSFNTHVLSSRTIFNYYTLTKSCPLFFRFALTECPWVQIEVSLTD